MIIMTLLFLDLIMLRLRRRSVLLTKNLKFSSHSGVVSQFGIHFIKTGIFKPELGRDFNRAFDDRSSADYGFKSEINKETAESFLSCR